MLSAVTNSLLICVVKLFIWYVAVCCLCVWLPDVLVCGMFGCEPLLVAFIYDATIAALSLSSTLINDGDSHEYEGGLQEVPYYVLDPPKRKLIRTLPLFPSVYLKELIITLIYERNMCIMQRKSFLNQCHHHHCVNWAPLP